jgi:hypothetical protein
MPARCSLIAIFLLLASSAFAKDIAIHAGRLVDTEARQIKSTVSILVHDDRISRIESGFISPPGAGMP